MLLNIFMIISLKKFRIVDKSLTNYNQVFCGRVQSLMSRGNKKVGMFIYGSFNYRFRRFLYIKTDTDRFKTKIISLVLNRVQLVVFLSCAVKYVRPVLCR